MNEILALAHTVTDMLPVTKKYKDCSDPLLIQRTTTSLITGEIKFAEFEKRCGARRKDKCEPCSEIWRDDAYFALINPSKNHSGSLTFITLTAPGAKYFGKTHTASFSRRKSERCACRRFHEPTDEILGLPLDPKTFEYEKIAEFNFKASRLASITLQKINRLMLAETNRGKSILERKTLKEVRLPTARVMEWQSRGVLHVHIIVRGNIPTFIVDMAVNGSAPTKHRRRVLPTEHLGQRWGTQIDVKHINSADDKQVRKLSSYVTKVVGYALKDVTASGKESNSSKENFHASIRRTTNRVVTCSKTFEECNASPLITAKDIMYRPNKAKRNFCLKHRKAHHQLGFTGNVLTMNKQWGSSLKMAREARASFARKAFTGVRNAVKAVRLEPEKKSISHVVVRKKNLNQFQYLANSKSLQTVDLKEMFVSYKT